jgi:hypothetical protein
MSDQELKETIEGLQKLREENTSSREKALEFLVKYGFVKPNGELEDIYKQSA